MSSATALRPSRRTTPPARTATAPAAPPRSRLTRVAAIALVVAMVGTLAAGLIGASTTDTARPPAVATPSAEAPEELAQLTDAELLALLEAQGLAIDPVTGEVVSDTTATTTTAPAPAG